ncbi:MAG: PepSY domain-containing protein [Planctomycetota bacterium]|jgi:hypothetical protein
MRLRIALVLLAAMVAGSVTVLALPEQGEDSIAFKDAPQAVQAAIRKVTTVEEIIELEKITDDGLTVYEVEFKKDGRARVLKFAVSGEVIVTEQEVDASTLPETVRTVLQKRFPGGEIVEAESITLHYYEVVVKAGGKVHEVKLLASGEMDDDEDEDDDEDDDEDEDEDEDGDEDDDDDEDEDEKDDD